MTQTTADFELGVHGNNVTTGDAGSATPWDAVQDPGAGTIQYDNTHAYGTLACKVVTAGSGAECCAEWNTALGSPTDHFGRAYIWLDALPTSADLRFVEGNTNNWRFDIRTSGEIRAFENAGIFVFDTTNTVPTGQWFRFEWHVIQSATVGQMELKLFNSPDSPTETETKTSAANKNTGASLTNLQFGDAGGNSSAATLWMDNLVSGATSYPGPVPGEATPSDDAPFARAGRGAGW